MDGLEDLDTEFAAAFRAFALAPAGALEPVVAELIGFALAVSVTHLHRESARAHGREALRLGATTAQLIDVSELAMLVGLHTMTSAAPLLAEEMAAAGHPLPAPDEAVRQRYVADRGALPPPLEPVLRLDPAYVDAYRAMSAIPVRRGNLSPKTVELILIALDASTTHLYAPGTRAHIRNALAVGATPAEILATLELTSTQAVAGTLLGFDEIRLGDPRCGR
jgi:alkylhydroperoxidase/carboxymuconolactone decarboxylase family protein YurZ